MRKNQWLLLYFFVPVICMFYVLGFLLMPGASAWIFYFFASVTLLLLGRQADRELMEFNKVKVDNEK